MGQELTSGLWLYFESFPQLKKEASAGRLSMPRVQDTEWDGKGWYLIRRYSQPCPRGCCTDSVFHARSAKQIAHEAK